MADEPGRTKLVTHQVLIAGGGPTGLMLAAELALARVDVAVVERRRNQELAGSRAGGLLPRALEVLDQRGIVERFLAQGQQHRVAPFAQTMLDIGDLPTRHSYYLGLWQAQIERALADWASELHVPMYRGLDVVDFVQDVSGVEVALSDGRTLRAQYLVGCDGGRSLIRKRAGIDFPGWDATASYLIAEADATEEPQWGIRRTRQGINALGKLDAGKRVRMVLSEPELAHADHADEPTLQDVRQALVAVYGTDFGVHNATWISRFTDMARQAATYRAQRVLLAGDAAHVHSPVGGQGLNIGLQDAVNLGWKLAQVVHGVAPDSLLDSYHAERHPVAARVLRNTMALTGLERGDDRIAALRELMTELLGVAEARQRYFAMMSGLDVHYELGPGHPLLGRRMPDLELTIAGQTQRAYTLLHEARAVLLCFNETCAREVGAWAGRVRRVEAQYTGAWDLPVLGVVPAPDAVLIRPDGYVAWVSEGSDRGLHDALTAWFGAAEPAASR